MASRTEQFLACKKALRQHPDFTDEQIGELLGLKAPELDLVATARRDLAADQNAGWGPRG